MISKQELIDLSTKIKKLNYHLIDIQEKLIDISAKETIDSVSGSNSNYPYQKTHFIIKGIDMGSYESLKKSKKKTKKNIEKLNKKLDYELKQLDIDIADIFKQRYIKGFEWYKIAMNKGYSNEAGVRNYFNRYFNKK